MAAKKSRGRPRLSPAESAQRICVSVAPSLKRAFKAEAKRLGIPNASAFFSLVWSYYVEGGT